VTEPSHAVFLSYASQDAEAAQKICEALRAAGIEVWFDQSELRGGDAWDRHIRERIHDCRLFIALISAHTEARDEGYFRREWKLAVDRTDDMLEKKAFLLPIVIDATPERGAAVPERFHQVQWTCLPRGEATPEFVARVKWLLSPESSATAGLSVGAPSGSQPIPLKRGRPPPLRRALPVAVAVLVVAALAFLLINKPWISKPAAPPATSNVTSSPAPPTAFVAPPHSIAVLPFVNMSGDDKDAYLGDGISGEILSALSQLPGLKVIGRASSFQFRGRDVDAVKVGTALTVRSLLTGTVQRAGDKVRISVELIDTTSGVQLWSQHFDRSFGNLFALEDDISKAVSATLVVKLGMTAAQPLVHAATDNPHAHDLYLRANELYYRTDEPTANQAVNLYNQAIAADPNYAAAWAGLAYEYLVLADAYRAPIDLLPVMKAAAEKAVALDSRLVEGHAYLSYILTSYQRDFAAGEREAEKSVALSPGSAIAQFFLGMDRIYTQHATSAQSTFQIAERLDPLNPYIPFYEVFAAIALGDSVTALQKAERTLEIDPAFSYFTDPLVLAYGSFGRWRDCIARFTATQLGKGSAREPDYKAAVCYAHEGNKEEAGRILAQLESAAQKRYVDHANMAEIYVALGEKDAAFKALEEAYNDRSQPFALVWSVPEFRSLHNDARYQALMERVHGGLKP
jgi:TolB-like protein